MNIVILDGATAIMDDYNYDNLCQLGTVTYYENTPSSLALVRARQADILITNKVEISSSLIDNCPNLKLIATQSTGYNVVDFEHAKTRNIPVCNIPAYSTPSVAQHTIALLLEATNHVGAHSESVIKGDWTKSKDFCYTLTPQIELYGKTIGLIGLGSIGKSVAKICTALGMKVIACKRTTTANSDIEICSLEEIYSASDIISLHCPLTPETTHIIDNDSIAKMRDNVIIINTARGGLVDENALSTNLANGKIFAYCSDVLDIEPQSVTCPLLGADNTIITPHIAWASSEARARLLAILEENIKCYLGGKVINCVNGF